MAWLTHLNPTPTFPAYTGPYKVGSVDVEIPTNQLESQGASDSPRPKLPTVAFRIFYPARKESGQHGVRWIPAPQREYLGAYARFLGAGNALSKLFSALPQILYYVTMPVHHNAALLEPPTKSKRWPVMVFSHGLGGSRNAYSQICGSLASHGVVVVAPDHRDGSAPISFVHTPDEKVKIEAVGFKKVAHTASTEVYEVRDGQLRIRLHELGFIYDALLKIDEGASLRNVTEVVAKQEEKHLLAMFARTLNVHEPGAISWAGHSFGAATMVHFVKSVFYRSAPGQSDYTPLFAPLNSSGIARQVTPASPVMLLDLWTLPIQSPSAAYLRSKPMPCYHSPAGGSHLLAILSEAFYKWKANLDETRRILSKPQASASAYPNQPGPHLFYPIASAHLSQSDFGVVFPWATTKIFGAKDPQRVLRLNVRAMLQVLRNAGAEVANTSILDMELQHAERFKEAPLQDEKILSRAQEAVTGWVAIGTETEERVERVENGPGGAMVEGEALGQVKQREDETV